MEPQDRLAENNGKRLWWTILCFLIGVPLLLIFTPLRLGVSLVLMVFEPKPETVTRSGQPIAQAISDFRSDHGLLPEKLDDLVPGYLPKPPEREWQWDFYNGYLVRHAGQPHSYVRYHFSGLNAGQWQYYPDSAINHRRLNIPGPISKPSSLTAEALFAAHLAECERRIERHRGDTRFYADMLTFYADKLSFLGLANRPELLREECERDAKLFPEWWLPEMILAEQTNLNPQAGQRFEAWVHRHPTFNNYWYLARCDRDQGHTTAALQTLEQATTQPVVKEPADSPWTGARLLFDACQFATENHNYDLTLKLAQLWELRGGEEESSLAFEALAELGLGHFDAAIEHANKYVSIMGQYHSDAGNLKELLRAAKAHETNFVYEPTELEPRWALLREPRP